MYQSDWKITRLSRQAQIEHSSPFIVTTQDSSTLGNYSRNASVTDSEYHSKIYLKQKGPTAITHLI